MLEKLFDNPSYLIVDGQWPMSMTEAEMKQVGFGYTGDQKVYRFPNGFGASLVQICILRTNPDEIMPYTGLHPVTDEPLWEVGVVQFNSDDDLDFTLTFEQVTMWRDIWTRCISARWVKSYFYYFSSPWL